MRWTVIIAYHVIFTTYGTWLPNDPRGSYSKAIYQEALKELGEIRYGRQDPQPVREVQRRFWTAARGRTVRPAVFFDGRGRLMVGSAFGLVVRKLGLRVPACAIMNDHVHLLVRPGKYRVEHVVNQLKGAVTRALRATETLWARNCWKIFINDRETLTAAKRYVEENPVKVGWSAQWWEFVEAGEKKEAVVPTAAKRRKEMAGDGAVCGEDGKRIRDEVNRGNGGRRRYARLLRRGLLAMTFWGGRSWAERTKKRWWAQPTLQEKIARRSACATGKRRGWVRKPALQERAR